MLFATATNVSSDRSIWVTSSYIFYSIFGEILSGFIISIKLKQQNKNVNNLSFRLRYSNSIYQEPDIILKAINFSLILFFSSYIAGLFNEQNSYWILISSASISTVEKSDQIKAHTVQRFIGSIVGLLLVVFRFLYLI